MSGFRLKFLLAVLIPFLFCLVPSVQAQRTSTRKLAPPQLAPQPAPVPTPLTLEQKPVTPPQISYQNGQLTIISENATLGDILTAVRNRTGASVDIPPNATERVVSHLGPGPAREVLASLLNGSHFNYVLLGSPSDPRVLDRVILIAKSSSPEISPSQPDTSAQVQQMPVRTAAPAPEEDDLASDDLNMDDTDTDGQADFANDATADPSQPGQPKTPEQMLQELQRQQQGLQQQQQPGGQQGFPLPGQFPHPQPQPQPQPEPPQ